MTDQDERRTNDRTTAALTGSSPDINAIFQTLVDRFLTIKGWMGAILAWWLSNIWILCAFGVTALLASIPFVDKLNEGKAEERSYQLEMFKVQSEADMKRLDRTMLGDGAMETLQRISDKLDQQGNQTTRIQLDMQQQNAKIEDKIQRLSDDVQKIQRAQASTDRKMRTLQETVGQ